MIFGSKDNFGIEVIINYELTENVLKRDSQSYYIFGGMCFWVTNHIIGDFDIEGILNIAVASIVDLLQYRGLRRDPKLWDKSAEYIFRTIDSALYVDVGQSDEQVALDQEQYSKFIAYPLGFDVFNRWKAYLIQEGITARYIWKQHNEDLIHEAIFGFDEFDKCLKEFIEWFNIQLYDF